MSYNMPQTQRKKGRPSTKLNKLNEIRNSISNQEVKRKADNLIERLAKGNDFNDTKRGIEFLKANEQQYGNADMEMQTLMLREKSFHCPGS